MATRTRTVSKPIKITERICDICGAATATENYYDQCDICGHEVCSKCVVYVRAGCLDKEPVGKACDALGEGFQEKLEKLEQDYDTATESTMQEWKDAALDAQE